MNNRLKEKDTDVDKKIEKERQNEDRLSDEDTTIDNEFELLQRITKVNIKEFPLTSDYILAYLGENEKTFVRENTETAEFVVGNMLRYATKGYHYKWNPANGDWEKNVDKTFKRVPLDEDAKDRIIANCEKLFTSYMLISHSIATLARNKSDNHMLNLVGGKAREIEKAQVVEKEEERSFIDKLKENF